MTLAILSSKTIINYYNCYYGREGARMRGGGVLVGVSLLKP